MTEHNIDIEVDVVNEDKVFKIFSPSEGFKQMLLLSLLFTFHIYCNYKILCLLFYNILFFISFYYYYCYY